jgi:hypothetical protein
MPLKIRHGKVKKSVKKPLYSGLTFLDMFNKPFNVVSAEYAVLNAKLRFYAGGHLNFGHSRVVLRTFVYSKHIPQNNYLKAIMGVICLILSLILIGRLLSK